MTMIAPILAIAALYAFLKWGAKNEAHIDATDIGNGVKIDHVQRWLDRALVATGAAFAIWTVGIFHYGLDPRWAKFMVVVLLGGAFWFSFWFRKYLNRERGKHRWYVAPWSNAYDRVWFALVEREWHEREWMGFISDIYNHSPKYGRIKRNIHRAGRLASITELSFATLSIGLALWIIYTPTP